MAAYLCKVWFGSERLVELVNFLLVGIASSSAYKCIYLVWQIIPDHLKKIVSKYLNMSAFFWWAMQVAAVHISVVTTRRTLWPLPVLAHTSTKCDGPPHRVTFIFTFTLSRYMSSDTLTHLTSTHYCDWPPNLVTFTFTFTFAPSRYLSLHTLPHSISTNCTWWPPNRVTFTFASHRVNPHTPHN